MVIFIQAFIFASLLTTSTALLAGSEFKQTQQFTIPEARQGVAVDKDYFYAVDNRSIAKYRKNSGELIKIWRDSSGLLMHLNSAVAIDGKLYAAHSNWPHRPSINTIEIWDAKTLKHIQSQPLENAGTRYFNWLDFHHGLWWGTLADYSGSCAIPEPASGCKNNTTLLAFDRAWKVLERWTFPEKLQKEFGAMSNSGGSWGPDGMLYLTGHDLPKIYQLKTPDSGFELEWMGTHDIEIRGQGIAWDRHQKNVLFGIYRATAEEIVRGTGNQVIVFKINP